MRSSLLNISDLESAKGPDQGVRIEEAWQRCLIKTEFVRPLEKQLRHERLP